MDFSKFTIKSQEVIQQAQQLAESNNNPAIENAHLLKGIFIIDKDVAPYLLNKLNVNVSILEHATDKIIQSLPKVSGGQLYLSQTANSTLNKAVKESEQWSDEYVSIELLLLTMLDSNDTIGVLLKDNKITKNELKQAIMDLRKGQKVTSTSQEGNYHSLEKFAKKFK